MSDSRPYKYDVIVVPQAWAFATKNPASGCQNCNPGDILCELGKIGCEAGAAASGSSNALQKNLGNALERDKKTINTLGGNLKTSYDKDMNRLGNNVKKDMENDPFLQASNGIQEMIDKLQKGGGIGGIFGEGGMMLPVIVIGGAVVLILLLKK